MKTTLSFGLMFAAVSAIVACSDDGTADRNNGGQQSTAGTSSGGTGGATGGTGGATGGTGGMATGGTGGGSTMVGRLGEPLTITGSGDDVVVLDESGETGINGGISLSQSMVMETPATNNSRDGALCMSGATEVVPPTGGPDDGANYPDYWGAELTLDLNRGANPNAPPGDAGADAGGDAGFVLGTTAMPWPYGDVIGFAYKVEGQNTAAADGGVPSAAFRFKALPTGTSADLNSYCSTRSPVDDAEEIVPFSEITFECWETSPPNPSLADDMIPYYEVAGSELQMENPRSLQNIAWQVPADTEIAHAFDFCVTEIRPIFAN